MKVNFLAHVLHLLAQAWLVGLDVTNDVDCDYKPYEYDRWSPELIPSMATNDIACIRINIKRLCSMSKVYLGLHFFMLTVCIYHKPYITIGHLGEAAVTPASAYFLLRC
jgi:hypothetical protein